MGDILFAECSCGHQVDGIVRGVGFTTGIEMFSYEPAYCDQCGHIEGRDNRLEEPYCERCNGRMHFYQNNADVYDDEGEIHLPESDYLEDGKHWHCPSCKQQTLQFTEIGLWD